MRLAESHKLEIYRRIKEVESLLDQFFVKQLSNIRVTLFQVKVSLSLKGFEHIYKLKTTIQK